MANFQGELNVMKDMVNFLAGVVVGGILGAVAALLLAPQSGAELRASLQEQANVERQRLQERYEQEMGKMQAQLDSVHKDVQAMLEDAKKPGEAKKA